MDGKRKRILTKINVTERENVCDELRQKEKE